MNQCPSCASQIPEERTSCPLCGTALEDSFVPTRLLADPPDSGAAEPRNNRDEHSKRKASSSRTPISFSSIDDARFIPGTVIAERYRIVGLLGKGGMGEVYRADDLKLGQPVALKFLPESLLMDGAALARFHREVRVARQISHRNICRVYDIGETDGHHFLSMEYIKGEELASLLKRIGRLPADKATQIARQICAGLAAAHDVGVLHRDLKPANVMIDENGNVRITDFGLAGLAEEFRADELYAGTPAYMAPERLAGKGVTVKSDIYSLGLVIYEVFTGKRAFDASTLQDLMRMHEDTAPASPSSLVKDIDPVVERVIVRCLEKEPERRPTSALQVAAALPGGDPIAAALAAGETPSPEMVAAAPKEGVLRPPVAVGLLAAFILLLVVSVWLAGKVALERRVPLEKSPDVLQERAREIANKVGYTQPPLDSDYGFLVKTSYLLYLLENDKSATRWDQLKTAQPPVLCFWYRQSPRYLEPLNLWEVTPEDPPVTISGMTGTLLDTRGRLIKFYGVPPEKEEAVSVTAEPATSDWSVLFNQAGLDLSDFKSAEPEWVPLYAYDLRAAWEGVYPEQPQIPVRVEAASYRGKPIYFEVLSPWDQPTRQEVSEKGAASDSLSAITSTTALFTLLIGMFLAVVIGSVVLAVRNLRLGRGDRRGAFRLALFIFFVRLAGWLFAHHVPTFGELQIMGRVVKEALFGAALFWFLYIALEPFVRRRWPGRIISWTRLLAGDFRDPLIGRDILIGAILGVALIPLHFIIRLLPEMLGWPSMAIAIEPGTQSLGLRYTVGALTAQIQAAFTFGFGFLFLLLLLAIILRKDWLAIGALWLICTAGSALATSYNPLGILLAPLLAALLLLPLVRYGLLAMLSAHFVHHIWIMYPMTFEFSSWYAGSFVVGLLVSLALVLYGYYISLGGQPLLGGALLED